MKKFLILLIEFYQRTFSPDTGINKTKHQNGFCKYYPSCSEYAKQSIKKYGVFRGILKSIWRILRCNPFSKGGIDLP
jgi:uncharacterized protein